MSELVVFPLASLHNSLPDIAKMGETTQETTTIPTTIPTTTTTTTLSEYELTRQQNIERNNAFLKEIGLFEVKQNLDPQTISPLPKTKSTKRKSKEINEDGEGGSEPLLRRKSTRLSKSPEDVEPLVQLPETFKEPPKSRVKAPLSSSEVEILVDDDEEEQRTGRLTSEGLSSHIERKCKEHYDDAKPEGIAHTVHRINTMTNKQLAMRMRKITKTDKLILFYYALDCIGLTELASSAKAILSKIHHVDVQ